MDARPDLTRGEPDGWTAAAELFGLGWFTNANDVA